VSEQLSLPQLAVMTALNEMLRSSHFSICTVDRCAEILEIPMKGNPSYRILSALHCIDYARIPQPLRGQIPELIKQCLGVEPMAILAEEEIKRTGWMRRLLS